MKIVVLILAGLITASAELHAQCDSVPVVADTSEFKVMVEKHDGIIIDVRTPEEYKTGIIEGAINIDFRSPEFNREIAKLDSTKTYYVYCEVGGRSRMAAEYMLSKGFCRVVTLQGGIKKWNEANYPVVIPKAKKGK